MADKSTEVSKVTKPKNPGRVAQGHKLAELNKQRKQQLKENPQEQPQGESSLPNKSTIILTLGVLGLVAYIVYDKVKKTPKTVDIPDKVPVTPKPAKNPTDVFKMR